MRRRDLRQHYDFFESVRADGSTPAPRRDRIDVAVLDMNHSWPNLGHDSVMHAVLDAAEELRDLLLAAHRKVRAVSYDVRRGKVLPRSGALFIATGGPGHIDPRQNDGRAPESQGVRDDIGWEAPLFRLFDSIERDPSAALIAICHSFGVLCRWSGVARAELRAVKSSGLTTNVLSDAAEAHPWFSRFAGELPDGRHYRAIDNRLFDLVLEKSAGALAFECEGSRALTMVELARDAAGMPRIFGMNHHPEVIDREHAQSVLEEKHARGEVPDAWVREREATLAELLQGENERQSRVTSEYTFLGPLRHHLRAACGAA